MEKHLITIRETLEKHFVIEAENAAEALNTVENLYNDGQLILTADDYYPDTDLSIDVDTITDEESTYYQTLEDVL